MIKFDYPFDKDQFVYGFIDNWENSLPKENDVWVHDIIKKLYLKSTRNKNVDYSKGIRVWFGTKFGIIDYDFLITNKDVFVRHYWYLLISFINYDMAWIPEFDYFGICVSDINHLYFEVPEIKDDISDK